RLSFLFLPLHPPRSTLFPYTTLFRSAATPGRSLTDVFADKTDPARDHVLIGKERHDVGRPRDVGYPIRGVIKGDLLYVKNFELEDRKSTRLNSSHVKISYAVFCLKKK